MLLSPGTLLICAPPGLVRPMTIMAAMMSPIPIASRRPG